MFDQENIFNNAPVRCIAFAMRTSSASTGSCTESLFSYERFNLRRIRILGGVQSKLEVVAADNCRLFFETIKVLNFEQENPSVLNENFEEHYSLGISL